MGVLIGSDRFARARCLALLPASVCVLATALVAAGCGDGSHAAGPAAASVNAAGGASTTEASTTGAQTGTASAPASAGQSGSNTVTGAGGQPNGAGGAGSNGTGSNPGGAAVKTGSGAPQPGHTGSGGKPAAKAKHKSGAGAGAGAGGAGAGAGGGAGSGSGASPSPGAPNASSGVPYTVETSSMEPTFQPETKIYYDPTATHPQVGQVIVFYLPAGGEEGACGEAMIGGRACANPVPGQTKAKLTSFKRVVGLPGDTIAIHEGRVIRNGQPESEPPILPCGKAEKVECEFPTPLTVPAGHYYVMADNRGLPKEDSRIFGAVPQEYILGTVVGS
jgi:signal peptidase I